MSGPARPSQGSCRRHVSEPMLPDRAAIFAYLTILSGSAGRLVISLVYFLIVANTLTLGEFGLFATASATGVILSRLLVMENVPTQIADALLSITENPVIILLMVNVFMIIIGMLMDDASGILLCTPILLPVVVALGVHPIHFAAILGVNLGMGLITPPTAPMLYLGCRVCKARVNDMLFPTMMFIIFAWLPTLLLTTFIPDLALTIPKMVLPKLFG